MEISIKSKSSDNKEPEEYEIKRWAELLIEAEEIKEDKEKMKYVKEYLDKTKDAITSIQDLKDLRVKRSKESNKEELEEESQEKPSEDDSTKDDLVPARKKGKSQIFQTGVSSAMSSVPLARS